MKTRPVSLYVVWWLGAALAALGGCAGTSEPTRFYMLQALPQPKAEQQTAGTDAGLTIGVGPVEIPNYLNRPQIVTRAGGNELKLAEFDKWAGSLKDDFPRVLAENLSALLSTDRILVYPWRGSVPIQYRVAVDVIQFDGKPGEGASLVARWAVFAGSGGKELLMGKSILSQPAQGPSYDALVAAMSRALEDLSREIAEGIQTLPE